MSPLFRDFQGSRVARRIVLAMLSAALLPLSAAVVLALMLTDVSIGIGVNETVRRGLANDIPLYRSLFDAKKVAYQASAEALARDPALRSALDHGDTDVQNWVDQALTTSPDLTRITLQAKEQRFFASAPADPLGRPFAVEQPVASNPDLMLRLEFQLPGRFVRELDEARDLAETYQTISAARDNIQRSLLVTFAAVLCVVLAGSIWVGLMLARNVTRRVARLAAATKLVADGDMTVRVKDLHDDEIAELALALNTMVAELAERRDRMVYLEKISGWQEVARRLAHEIKNPLTPIVLAVQQLDEKKPAGDEAFAKLVRTAREIVEEEAATLRHLVEEFSAFAKLPEVRPDALDLSQYLDETASQIATTTANAEIALEIDPDLGTFAVDRIMLRRVIANLVLNAVEAQSGRDGPARVRIAAHLAGAGCELLVDDAGPGIEPAVAPRLFEPYMTTKKHGTGLGLAIVKKIVLQHGGTIAAGRSPELGGARIEIHLDRGRVAASSVASDVARG